VHRDREQRDGQEASRDYGGQHAVGGAARLRRSTSSARRCRRLAASLGCCSRRLGHRPLRSLPGRSSGRLMVTGGMVRFMGSLPLRVADHGRGSPPGSSDNRRRELVAVSVLTMAAGRCPNSGEPCGTTAARHLSWLARLES
jgi:hypothetical protein